MSVSDIFYARFPIDTDRDAVADTTEQLGLIATVFPIATHTILDTYIVTIGGNNGVYKNVMVVVAQQTSQFYF